MTALLPPPAVAAAPDAPWRARLAARVDGRGGWGWTALVVLLAGLLRFVRLDLPFNGSAGGKVFDEVYYACDAVGLLSAGVELATVEGGTCAPSTGDGAFVVHPPLGKWAIALGIRAFGEGPFAWRSAAALAGTLTVLLVVRAGRRMTGSTLLGCLAGLLLAVDGLHLVQSRVAMLDVFLVLWTTAAFAALLVDRDRVRAALAAATDLSGHGPRLGARPWRLVAGLCLGAALATKWSAVYYAVVLVLLAVAWEVGARRTAGVRAPFRATVARSLLPLTGALALLPVAVYVASYAGWFRSDRGFYRDWAATTGGFGAEDGLAASVLSRLPDALQSLVHYHREILQFHDGLDSPHPYQSHPQGWLLLARPVSYYYPPGLDRGDYGCDAASCAREVLAIGNPVLWWGTLPVLVALVWLWLARRDWRAAALLPLVLAGVVPWIRDDLADRTMFLFYALPAVPFMALSAALVGGWLVGGPHAPARRRRWGAAAVGVYVAAAVLALAWFYPVLAAQTISIEAWRDRMWFPSWI